MNTLIQDIRFGIRMLLKSPSVSIVVTIALALGIGETFAKQQFPNEDPIGKRVHPGIASIEGEDSVMREIIGVVGDVRNRGLSTEPRAA